VFTRGWQHAKVSKARASASEQRDGADGDADHAALGAATGDAPRGMDGAGRGLARPLRPEPIAPLSRRPPRKARTRDPGAESAARASLTSAATFATRAFCFAGQRFTAPHRLSQLQDDVVVAPKVYKLLAWARRAQR
jgi:hypothetical protein